MNIQRAESWISWAELWLGVSVLSFIAGVLALFMDRPIWLTLACVIVSRLAADAGMKCNANAKRELGVVE